MAIFAERSGKNSQIQLVTLVGTNNRSSLHRRLFVFKEARMTGIVSEHFTACHLVVVIPSLFRRECPTRP